MATVKIFTALSYHSPHEQCPSDAEQAQRAAAAARLIHLNLAARSTSTVQPAPPPAPTPSLQVGILKRASSGNPPSSGQDANETRTQPAKKRVRMDLPEEEDVVEPSPKSSRALDSGEEDPREDMLRKTVPHSSFYSKPASSSSPAASGTRARSTRPSLPSPPQELTVEVEAPTSSVVLESYEAEKRGTTDLGTAAIERCIPAPYRHVTTFPATDQNPRRQHPSKIRHSFVDPPPAKRGSAITHDTADSYLTPGRRGAWIIPVSGPLPIPHASTPSWSPSPTPSSSNRLAPPPSKASAPKGSLPVINWTDARLTTFWTILTTLHEKALMGEVKAHCAFASSSSSSPLTSSAHANTSGIAPRIFHDHIRVSAEAHLALPLRTLLGLVSVTKAGTTAAKEGEEEVDGEKFLEKVRLVWVDERGRPVLTA